MHPLSSAVYFSAPKYKLIGTEKTERDAHSVTPQKLTGTAEEQLLIKHWKSGSSFPAKHRLGSAVTESPTAQPSLFLQGGGKKCKLGLT